MSKSKIERSVEVICNQGCQQVRQAISLLEQGKLLPEVESLSTDERTRLLGELKSIMSVYGDSCRVGD
ncbi:MAG: hypothetical protein ABW148_02045 [Sedimenticola sp.]